MHGEEGLPLLSPIYRVHSYELLVALVSHLTSFSCRGVYYLLFPSVFAAYLVIANWIALRELQPKVALLGVVFVLIILLAWGQVDRAYGQFAFIRLYHGKCVFASVLVPALLYYASCYARRPGWKPWIFLLLAQVTAVGLSSTALLVAPPVAGVALLGGWVAGATRRRALMYGLLSSVYVVALGIVVGKAAIAGPKTWEITPSHDLDYALETVMGWGMRPRIALFALLAGAALPFSPAWYRGFLLLSVALLLNPWTSEFLGRLNCWRALWALPMPFITAFALASLASLGPSWKHLRAGAVAATGLILLFVFSPYRKDENQWGIAAWAIRPGWFEAAAVPLYHFPNSYRIAEVTTALTPPDGVVLAPDTVSAWIATFPNSPRLVGVRGLYFGVVEKGTSHAEALTRSVMQGFIRGDPSYADRMAEVVEGIQTRAVTTVVVPAALNGREPFEAELKKLGFTVHPQNSHNIWLTE